MIPATPSAAQNMTSPDRSRYRHIWRSAPATKWEYIPTVHGLRTKRRDGIHVGGPPRGMQTEHQANRNRHGYGAANRAPDERGRKVLHPCGHGGPTDADHDAHEATQRRDGQGLEQELRHDVLAARADRAPHADLLPPFGDRNEHQAHD